MLAEESSCLEEITVKATRLAGGAETYRGQEVIRRVGLPRDAPLVLDKWTYPQSEENPDLTGGVTWITGRVLAKAFQRFFHGGTRILSQSGQLLCWLCGPRLLVAWISERTSTADDQNVLAEGSSYLEEIKAEATRLAGGAVTYRGQEIIRGVGLSRDATLVLDKWTYPQSEETPDLTGGETWIAGRVLAKAFPCLGDLAGRHILEIGSGTGISGLAAASYGAHVILTDLPPVIPSLEHNVARNLDAINSSSGSVTVRHGFSYTTDTTMSAEAVKAQNDDFSNMLESVEHIQLLLCSDVVWYAEQAQPLAWWCSKFRKPMLMSYTVRTQRTTTAVFEGFKEAGFERTVLAEYDIASWEETSEYDKVMMLLFVPVGQVDPVPWLTSKLD